MAMLAPTPSTSSLMSHHSFSNHSTPTIDDGGWSTFDMSLIHPAHGLNFDTHPPTLSAAEKLLASMESHYSEDGLEDSDMATDEDCDEDDYSDSGMDGEERDESYFSEASLETPASSYSSTASVAENLLVEHSSMSGFPFPESATVDIKGKGRARSRSFRTSEKPALQSTIPQPSPAIQLERISSCYFSPPDPSKLLAHEQLVPLDSTLEERILSNPSSAIDLPSLVRGEEIAQNRDVFSSSLPMQPLASSSSMMMRSYSAPAHTQNEYAALRKRWNAEAASTRPASRKPFMSRRASSAVVLSLTSTKPYTSTRRTRDEADLSNSLSASHLSYSHSYDTEPHTFTGRERLLSPAHKHNPFKRSKLSLISEERSVSPPCKSNSVFDPSYSPTATSASPKSPSRPGLNRFFTMPEFFMGDGQDEDDEDGASN